MPITKLNQGTTSSGLDVSALSYLPSDITDTDNLIIIRDGTAYKNTAANVKAYANGTSQAPLIFSSDPYAANVLIHLKGDGTNNSTSIIDSSLSPKTIALFGDVKISTAQSKYGGSSIYFDGSGDFLSFTGSIDSGSSQPFTIEAWVRPATQYPELFSGADSNNAVQTGYKQISQYGSGWGISKWGSGQLINYGGSVFTANAWHHVAICKNSSNVVKLFVNGSQIGSDVTINESWQTSRIVLGFNASSQYPAYLQAYVDNYRITSGVCRYTSTFNPETDTYFA